MTIELGGTLVELNFLGRSHSDNMTIVRFPKEGVVMAVDVVQMNSIGFGPYSDAYFPDFIDSLKRIEAMDFDIVIPGHGAQGDRSNVTAYRLYLEDLRGQVQTLVRAGKSLEEIQADVDLTKYTPTPRRPEKVLAIGLRIDSSRGHDSRWISEHRGTRGPGGGDGASERDPRGGAPRERRSALG